MRLKDLTRIFYKVAVYCHLLFCVRLNKPIFKLSCIFYWEKAAVLYVIFLS